MMKISTFLGSALGVLLVFSVFSYAKTFIQAQEPKAAPKSQQTLEVAGQIPENEESSSPVVSAPVQSVENADDTESTAVPGETYSATAYSLRGRTASGQFVSRGLIAADPRVLPLGTRVRLDAGPWSGEYLVADTGGAIKGRKIDIWTPTTREALQFGRRPVKLTILSFPARQARTVAVRPRVVKSVPTSTSVATETARQEK